jgi:hypothetical protein
VISAGHSIETSLYSIIAVDDQMGFKVITIEVTRFKTHNPSLRPLVHLNFLFIAFKVEIGGFIALFLSHIALCWLP